MIDKQTKIENSESKVCLWQLEVVLQACKIGTL